MQLQCVVRYVAGYFSRGTVCFRRTAAICLSRLETDLVSSVRQFLVKCVVNVLLGAQGSAIFSHTDSEHIKTYVWDL